MYSYIFGKTDENTEPDSAYSRWVITHCLLRAHHYLLGFAHVCLELDKASYQCSQQPCVHCQCCLCSVGYLPDHPNTKVTFVSSAWLVWMTPAFHFSMALWSSVWKKPRTCQIWTGWLIGWLWSFKFPLLLSSWWHSSKNVTDAFVKVELFPVGVKVAETKVSEYL